MEIDLKPCPFCGSRLVKVNQSTVCLNGLKYFRIYHWRYDGKCPLVDSFGNFYSSAKYGTERKAIEAWNRRANNGTD